MESRHLTQLPIEILEHIFSSLNANSMLNAQTACKQFFNHFSIWNQQPILNRKKYLAENKNRANHLLQLASKSDISVLLLGNRSMQANIISRPKYFLTDALPPTGLDEDRVKVTKYNIRIFSSLHDGFSQQININEEIKNAHVLILCVANEDDYKMKVNILKKTLETCESKPFLFVAKPTKNICKVDLPVVKILDLEADYKQDKVARIIVERLSLLDEKRRNEIVNSNVYRSKK